MRADLSGTHRRHLELALRISKPFETALAHWIDADNPSAPLARRTQLTEHAWMIGTGILSEDKDCVGESEVFQRHCALANTNRLPHGRATWLVAHIGTIGEIVGAVFAYEQLVEERSFVTG